MAKWEKFHAQFYGITQTGKTHQALSWLGSHTGLRLFIDTKAETYTKKKFKNLFHYIIPLNRFQEIIDNFQFYYKQNAKIALIPTALKLDKEMKEFVKVLWKFKVRNIFKMVCLIDEVQEYSCKKEIRSLFVQGLSKRLVMGLTSQGWSQVDKNIRRNCELTVILKQTKKEIAEMMEQDILPYDTNEQGWRISKVKFTKKYQCYAEIGKGGKFMELN